MRIVAILFSIFLITGIGEAKEVLKLFQKRHSAREFDVNRKVSEEQIRVCLEAARLSPSCYNDQPWRFIVCDKWRDKDGYDKALSTLVPFNQNWAKDADVLVIVCANLSFSKDQKPNRWGYYDTGAAAMSFCLQASELGLMTHQMGGFDEIKASKAFTIPDGYSPISVIAVGCQKKESALKTMKAKDRRPACELFYNGCWGEEVR